MVVLEIHYWSSTCEVLYWARSNPTHYRIDGKPKVVEIVVNGELEEHEALGVFDIDGPALEGKGNVERSFVWHVEPTS